MLRGFDEGYEIPSYGVWISSKYANKGLAKLTLQYSIIYLPNGRCEKDYVKVSS